MKTSLATLLITAIIATSSHAAVILLGGFDGGTSNTVDLTGEDDAIQDASAVGNVDVTVSGVNFQRSMNSLSPLWGTTDLDPDPNNNVAENVAVQNGGTYTLTFVISNTGTDDISLEQFHIQTRRDQTNSDQFADFTYVGGDLGAGGASEVLDMGAALGTTVGFDRDISNLVSDTTLSAGESATFSFAVASPASGDWIRVDNIAFSGEIVPEPSPLALLGLGGLIAFSRRRRS